ncbi:hypothetical protein VaNZ11_013602 [Volvox africanus]|uniref:Uncharacterized protein n=1 Tax=Volvox africanus TaxID=51714 RepID=A0ABQ5SH14_9CHLO|nr:hypothetical protein VaNZ11_013602 [Volvox africanus]
MFSMTYCHQKCLVDIPFANASRQAGSARRMRWSRHFTPASSLVEESDFVSSPTNLGQLERFVVQQQSTPGDNDLMSQRVDPRSFNERGLYIDGASIFASSVLLLVLMAFSTNRIFGLDRFFASAARSWKDEMRKRDELVIKTYNREGFTKAFMAYPLYPAAQLRLIGFSFRLTLEG